MIAAAMVPESAGSVATNPACGTAGNKTDCAQAMHSHTGQENATEMIDAADITKFLRKEQQSIRSGAGSSGRHKAVADTTSQDKADTKIKVIQESLMVFVDLVHSNDDNDNKLDAMVDILAQMEQLHNDLINMINDTHDNNKLVELLATNTVLVETMDKARSHIKPDKDKATVEKGAAHKAERCRQDRSTQGWFRQGCWDCC
jgi:hypothetical protein